MIMDSLIRSLSVRLDYDKYEIFKTVLLQMNSHMLSYKDLIYQYVAFVFFSFKGQLILGN